MSAEEQINELRERWKMICCAMNKGTWRSTEAAALAEIDRIKASIAALEATT